MPAAKTAWISSTMVRELTIAGRLDDVKAMVPPAVHSALVEKQVAI